MTPLNSSALRRAQVFVQFAAIAVAGVGLLGLLGWMFGIEALKAPLMRGITIKANAALGLFLAGSALWLLRSPSGKLGWQQWVGQACAMVAALIGGLTMLQHMTDWDLGIDQLIAREPPGALATASPGRMGRPSGSSLFMAGLALLLIDSKLRLLRRMARLLAGAICALILVPLVGFIYEVVPLYGVPGYTGIALQTALALLMLGLGILFSRPTEGLIASVCADDVGGLMARRLAPMAFLLPIVTWWLRVQAEELGWVDTALARPIAVLFLSGASLWAVLWIASGMSRLEQARRKIAFAHERGSARTVEILESISDAFYAVDAAGQFTYVNRQAEELWGRSRNSLLGKKLWTEFAETITDVEAAAHRAVLNQRQQRSFETYSARASRWFEVSLYPESGGGVSGFFRDVTHRKQVEEELRSARDSAEKANRAKSEFLATLSHEMRTPLNPVLLTLDYLEAHPQFPAVLREEVSSIRRHVDLEIQLISDLLDVTRIEAGKFELHLADVDMHEVVRGAVTMCQRQDSPEITLALQASRPVVRGDAVRLHQVVWNLLNNAQKFTDPNGRISIGTSTPGSGRLQIEVVDTGVGISPELLPRMFNAFEQGESRTARQRGGLGLGLSITRKVVEAHDGTITALSDGPGRGARFVVDLPAMDVAPARRLPAAAVSTRPDSPSLKILLVEDHVPTSEAVARLLSMMGHQVQTASTAEKAEQLASSQAFDVLMSDVGLPGKSGLDLMQSFRGRFDGRAIAVSGYGTEEDIRLAKEAGFAEHITKPVQLSILKAALARLAGD